MLVVKECWKREATMGCLTIFYKNIIQQYFTVTAPNTAFMKYLKQNIKFENFNYLNVAFISYKLTMWDWMLYWLPWGITTNV